jgi:hypothetical protein
LQNHFLQFDKIITKTYSKFNISQALSLQISKSPLLNFIRLLRAFHQYEEWLIHKFDLQVILLKLAIPLLLSFKVSRLDRKACHHYQLD